MAHASPASGAEPLATRSSSEPCLSLVLGETLKVSELKAQIVSGLGLDCSAPCLRLYKRSGVKTGVVLRDGRRLRQSLTGGFDDKEVVVQRLAAEETLSDTTLLLKYTMLGEAGVPAPSQLLRVQSTWSFPEMLAALSASTGVAAEALSVAKPPTVGANNLSAAMMAKLRWDEPKLLATPKIGSHPLQLRDGDGLLLRVKTGDGVLGSRPPLGGAAPAAGARAKPWLQRRGGAGDDGGGDVVVARGGGGRPTRPERGVVIRTMYDEPTAKEKAALGELESKEAEQRPQQG